MANNKISIDVTHNVKIDGLDAINNLDLNKAASNDNTTKILSEFGKKVDSLGANLKSITSNLSKIQGGISQASNSNSQTAKNNKDFATSILTSNKALKGSFDNVLDKQIRATEKNNKLLEKQNEIQLKTLNFKQQQYSDKGVEPEQNKLKKLMPYVLGVSFLGGALALANQYQAYGSVVGSGANAINSNIGGASGFVSQYQSSQMMSRQQMQNTATTLIATTFLGLLGGILTLSPIGVGIGSALGAGISSYFNNSNNQANQEQIAKNNFMISQDFNAWRSKYLLGSSSSFFKNIDLGNTGVNDSIWSNSSRYAVNINDINKQMMNNPDYAPYASYLSPFMMNSNRNYRSSNLPQDIKDTVTSAQLLGVSDQSMPSFISAITTISASNGKSTTSLLNDLLTQSKNYGGDTVKNLAQMVDIMQKTSLGYNASKDLVYRYQYNQPALQNVVNMARITPLNRALSRAYMHLLPSISGSELESGFLSGRHLNEYHRLQRTASLSKNGQGLINSIIMDMIGGATSQDLNVNRFAVYKRPKDLLQGDLKGAEANSPVATQAFSNLVNKYFSNLKVDTQNVTAQKVVINAGNQWGGYYSENPFARSHANNGGDSK